MSVSESIETQSSAAGENGQYRLPRLHRDELKSRQQRSRRATFIKWLRNVHSWVGLWGAALGLLFGTTGFFLNHRGGPLKVSTGEPQVSVVQVPLPQPAPETPRELAKWLKGELKIAGNPGRVQKEPEHRVAWGDRSVVQPEHWQLNIASPRENTSAEYWVGNSYVTVKRSENTFLAMLTNMHKGVGLSVGWVLLIDTLAGSLILLSLTGVLLWTELNKRKTVGAVLVLGSIVALVCMGSL
ncbi:PepSY-associated TM helix domain-containing protein [Paraburkholderia sp.]|uniref:PepSY-associated TM helix domain-containing protein n=1 Tax=Paraburkholderia sp. TaxID=1926495 RepID=UPI002F406F20